MRRLDIFVETIAVAPAGGPRMLIDAMGGAGARRIRALLGVTP